MKKYVLDDELNSFGYLTSFSYGISSTKSSNTNNLAEIFSVDIITYTKNNGKVSYNLTYSSYIIPTEKYMKTYVDTYVNSNIGSSTKNYIDSLIKANDALRYCGIYTPASTSGKFGTFGSSDSSVGDHPSLKSDYSAGSVFKVASNGYFGTRFVHANDLLISYSDSATSSSITGWDVIESHIDFQDVENTNTSSRGYDKYISNVHIDETGILSYSSGIVSLTHDNNSSQKFLTGISLTTGASGIKLSYQSGNLSTDNTPKANDTVTKDFSGEFKYVSAVNLSSDGKLSYAYNTIKLPSQSHHTNTNSSAPTYTNIGFEGIFSYIQNVNLSTSGTLTYAYGCLKLPTQAHHTTTNTPILNDSNSPGFSGSFKYVSAVNLTDKGTLSYAYHTVYLPSQSHHSTDKTVKAPTAPSVNTSNSTISYVQYVNLSDTGKLSYTYGTATLLGSEHHSTTSNADSNGNLSIGNGGSFTYIGGVSISKTGALSYIYRKATLPTSVSNAGNADNANKTTGTLTLKQGNTEVTFNGSEDKTFDTSHSTTSPTYPSATSINFGETFSYIQNVNLSSKGTLTYTYGVLTLPTKPDNSGHSDTSDTANKVANKLTITHNGTTIEYDGSQPISLSNSSKTIQYNGNNGNDPTRVITNVYKGAGSTDIAYYYASLGTACQNFTYTYNKYVNVLYQSNLWTYYKANPLLDTATTLETAYTSTSSTFGVLSKVSLESTGIKFKHSTITLPNIYTDGSKNTNGTYVLTNIKKSKGDDKITYTYTPLGISVTTDQTAINQYFHTLSNDGLEYIIKSTPLLNTTFTKSTASYSAGNTLGVFTGVSLSNNGLTFTYSSVTIPLKSSSSGSSGVNANNGARVLTNIYKSSSSDTISYTYYNLSYSTTTNANTAYNWHVSNISQSNLDFKFHGNKLLNTSAASSSKTYGPDDGTIMVVTGATINNGIKFTYSTITLNNKMSYVSQSSSLSASTTTILKNIVVSNSGSNPATYTITYYYDDIWGSI
jgi:hypothetical protein